MTKSQENSYDRNQKSRCLASTGFGVAGRESMSTAGHSHAVPGKADEPEDDTPLHLMTDEQRK